MFISELQYADHCVVVASSPTELQDALNIFDQAYTALGMKINYGKTKILKTNASQHVYLVNGEALEKVDRFC